MFINLFNNSFYATSARAKADGEGYQPLLTVRSTGDHESVRIAVRDNGTGISAAAREKLFSPFFTTKPAGEGTGLGLANAQKVIEELGGTLLLDEGPSDLGGAAFIVALPLAGSEGALDGDGSIDLYFGPTAPAGKRANWIQTVAGKGWFSLLRLYSPTEAWWDKTWRPGEIELLQ